MKSCKERQTDRQTDRQRHNIGGTHTGKDKRHYSEHSDTSFKPWKGTSVGLISEMNQAWLMRSLEGQL
jgi:hypothetical protein